MTDSEQVKAALAALAAGECQQPERGRNDVTSLDANGERSDPRAQRPTSEATGDHGFEWGTGGTTAEVTPERDDGATDYRTIIERAVDATEDVEAAAAFVESVGLDRLEAAVETAEHEVSGLAADGRAALAAFERFRAVAAGSPEA